MIEHLVYNHWMLLTDDCYLHFRLLLESCWKVFPSNFRFFIFAFKLLFVIFTSVFIAPPIQVYRVDWIHDFKVGWKQWMSFSFKEYFIYLDLVLFETSLISVSATTKFVLLLLGICLGWPLLHLNRLRAKTKLSVDTSPANSCWIAWVGIQVRRAPDRFTVTKANLLCFLNLIRMGPK